jgi:hypothetical protein
MTILHQHDLLHASATTSLSLPPTPHPTHAHLDLVVIASGHEQRLRVVKVDAAHRAVVLIKAVYEGAHAVVP